MSEREAYSPLVLADSLYAEMERSQLTYEEQQAALKIAGVLLHTSQTGMVRLPLTPNSAGDIH